MALTRITKGVIKPNENYDTHDINSTGIVTTTGLDVNGNADVSGSLSVGGVLTYEDVTSIDSVGIITARQGIHVGAGVSAVGIVTAATFKGDGDFVDIDVDGHTNLDNVSIAGVTTITSSTFPLVVHADTNYQGILINGNNAPTLGFNTADNDTPKWKIGLSGSNQNDLAIGKGAGNTNQFRMLDAGGASLLGTLTAEHLGIDGHLYHNGDTDTRLLFGTDTIDLKTGGSTRLRAENSGVNITGIVTATSADINGDLDVDGHTNLDNVSVAGVTTFANNVLFGDNKYIKFGTGNDMSLYHDGTNSLIANITGPLALQSNDLQLTDVTNSHPYIKCVRDAQVELYYDNSKKLHTVTNGIDVTGMCTDDGARHDGDVYFIGGTSGRNAVWDMSDNALEFADNAKAKFGSSDDLQIYHDTTDSLIDFTNTAHNLRIRGDGDIRLEARYNELSLRAVKNAHVELYYDASTYPDAKLVTSEKGIKVGTGVTVETNGQATYAGIVTATSFSGSGANLTGIDTDLVSDSSPQLGGTLDGNGQTANFTANNTGLGIPIGTDANEPTASSYKGYMRYNDDDDIIYYSDGSNWKKISAEIAILSSISGSIYVGTATNLTLSGSGFLSANLVVNFLQSADSINTNVTVTPSNDASATVAVPAAVYNNVTAGRSVTIKVTNSDSSTSGTVNITALALPTGGNIYTSGGYRYHKFTSSGTFTQTLSKTVEYLIVAGGGAGGGGNSSSNRLGGGGGAGGLRGGSVSTTPQGYSITIGGGGSGTSSYTGNSGSNSSAFGITSNGGGGGGGGDGGNGNGGNGGSGGGGGRGGAGGSGTSGQGNNGGNHNSSNNPQVQGGGGGAGAAGNNGSNNGSNGNGYGGVGSNAYSTWASATSSGHSGYYAGGGGAGWHGSYSTTRALGGNGGGGNGGDSSSDNSNAYGFTGTANTGGGGGGNSTTSPHNGVSGAPDGPAGGSGIVIIRYQL